MNRGGGRRDTNMEKGEEPSMNRMREKRRKKRRGREYGGKDKK